MEGCLSDHDLFAKAGHALFGDNWKSPLAEALDIRETSVRAMAKGRVRIPPGIWRSMFHLLMEEVARLNALAKAASDRGWTTDTKIGGPDEGKWPVGYSGSKPS